MGDLKEVTYKDTWLVRDSKIDDYDSYLLSPEWEALKARLKEQTKYKKCRACGKTKCIQFHHKTYKYIGSDKEELGIVALCCVCHKWLHIYAKNKDVSIERATKYIIANAKEAKPKKIKKKKVKKTITKPKKKK